MLLGREPWEFQDLAHKINSKYTLDLQYWRQSNMGSHLQFLPLDIRDSCSPLLQHFLHRMLSQSPV